MADNNGNPQGNNPVDAPITIDQMLNSTGVYNPNEPTFTNDIPGLEKVVEQSPVVPEVKDPVVPENVESEFDKSLVILNTDDSVLSAEDKEFKTSLLSSFNGEKLDAQGNIVNKDGKVVLSADNFKKYVETGSVLVDDKGNEIKR